MKPHVTTYDVSCNINNHSKEEILEAARPHADLEAAVEAAWDRFERALGSSADWPLIVKWVAETAIVAALGADDE